MYDTLLIDLDDTILDFKAAEAHAISQVLGGHGITATAEHLATYARINQGLWEQLERKELTIDRVLYSRFESFFATLGISVDGAREESLFRGHLNSHALLIPEAGQLLKQWHASHHVYAISNGLYDTQMARLEKAGITNLFHGLFISEQIGANKPDPAFFDHVAHNIPDFSRKTSLVVGDSLTSDIQGGNLAGIHTCWFNRFDLAPPAFPLMQPVHIIRRLSELNALLYE